MFFFARSHQLEGNYTDASAEGELQIPLAGSFDEDEDGEVADDENVDDGEGDGAFSLLPLLCLCVWRVLNWRGS